MLKQPEPDLVRLVLRVEHFVVVERESREEEVRLRRRRKERESRV